MERADVFRRSTALSGGDQYGDDRGGTDDGTNHGVSDGGELRGLDEADVEYGRVGAHGDQQYWRGGGVRGTAGESEGDDDLHADGERAWGRGDTLGDGDGEQQDQRVAGSIAAGDYLRAVGEQGEDARDGDADVDDVGERGDHGDDRSAGGGGRQWEPAGAAGAAADGDGAGE